ncbi:MAG: nodulation protein NfeD [Spirochaetota bacterium]|nr:MAG: nodulation protein NfeD [Spirochaetota bacterium]
MKINVIILILVLFLTYHLYAEDRESAAGGAWIVPVQGEINRSMVVFIRRNIDSAIDERADYLIFDIDTFGGRADSALQITTLIGSVEDTETIAYITTGPESLGVSWSAGAIISFSCERIYMAPGTSIGAAAPVYMTQEGPESASEKVVSAIRAQIAALAEKNGYPVNIAKAMVDEDISIKEVWVDGQLMVLTEEEIEEAKRRAKSVEVGKTVSQQGKLLTLTAKEMERYGVSSGTYARADDLLQELGIENEALTSVEETMADRAVSILTSSAVTGILILAGLFALFLEITSPGFGVPGTAAIICFAIVFASYALLGTVGSLELILFVLGLVMLIVEIFLIPGFGVVGISGIVLIVLSLILSMQGFVWPQYTWQWNIFRRNILVVISSTAVSIIAFAILVSVLPQMKLFSRLTLQTVQAADEGYTVQKEEDTRRLLGRKGKAITTLRPSGKVEIEGDILVVETDGEFIEKDTLVEIIEVSGNRIVVRKS